MADPGVETTIGRRVRAARERRGLKREELAVESGLSWSAIAQIEAGRRTNLRPPTVAALARTLRVTTDYLIGVDPTPGVLEHHALLYDGGHDFVIKATPLIKAALERDEPMLAVTSRGNIRRLRDGLGGDADAVRFEDSKRWYRSPDATLLAYRRFADESLAAGANWIRVIGEPVWVGQSRTQQAFWARYEALVNLAFAHVPMTIVCPYDAASLPDAIVTHARCTHRHSLAGDDLHANPEYVDPAQFVLEQ